MKKTKNNFVAVGEDDLTEEQSLLLSDRVQNIDNFSVDITNSYLTSLSSNYYVKPLLHTHYQYEFLEDLLKKHPPSRDNGVMDIVDFFIPLSAKDDYREAEKKIMKECISVALENSMVEKELHLMELCYEEELESVTKRSTSIVWKSDCIEVRRCDGREDVVLDSEETRWINEFFEFSDDVLKKHGEDGFGSKKNEDWYEIDMSFGNGMNIRNSTKSQR